MDLNKLKVLQDLNYKILPVCGLCRHGEFPKNQWGTCMAKQYQHGKHTGSPRQLSIHQFGSCEQFEKTDNTSVLSSFGGFVEFLPK